MKSKGENIPSGACGLGDACRGDALCGDNVGWLVRVQSQLLHRERAGSKFTICLES